MQTPITYVLAAASLVGGFAGGALVLPEPSRVFMTVHEIVQIDDMVRTDRTIHDTTADGQGVIADWRVTIVPDGGLSPVCQTLPGKARDQGWSSYTPDETYIREMHLDAWVGDPGCYDRLAAGAYREFVTWTPRDNSDPVTHTRTFEKGER